MRLSTRAIFQTNALSRGLHRFADSMQFSTSASLTTSPARTIIGMRTDSSNWATTPYNGWSGAGLTTPSAIDLTGYTSGSANYTLAIPVYVDQTAIDNPDGSGEIAQLFSVTMVNSSATNHYHDAWLGSQDGYLRITGGWGFYASLTTNVAWSSVVGQWITIVITQYPVNGWYGWYVGVWATNGSYIGGGSDTSLGTSPWRDYIPNFNSYTNTIINKTPASSGDLYWNISMGAPPSGLGVVARAGAWLQYGEIMPLTTYGSALAQMEKTQSVGPARAFIHWIFRDINSNFSGIVDAVRGIRPCRYTQAENVCLISSGAGNLLSVTGP